MLSTVVLAAASLAFGLYGLGIILLPALLPR
jgi:hypothetical protein